MDSELLELQSQNVIDSGKLQDKIIISLVKHVYNQSKTGAIGSLFCAAIVVLTFYEKNPNDINLYIWSGYFLLVTFLRSFLAIEFKKWHTLQNMEIWRMLYILGTCLSGMAWGTLAFYFLPTASPLQEILIFFMLAGVTAGSVPLSAGIPTAGIGFLSFSLIPFIVAISIFKDRSYLLFSVAFVIFYFYLISLILKNYQLLKNTVILQYNNHALLVQLKINNRKLKKAATHDPLTQVANRALLSEKLTYSIQKAQENNGKIALFYLDLDHFKEANDRYGHAVGDIILVTVINRLKNSLRKNDVIARLGGDELVIIIQDAKDIHELEIIAKKLGWIVASPIPAHDFEIKISASIGISIYPDDASNSEELLRKADASMYLVKKEGGNHYHFAQELVVVEQV